MSMLKSVDLPTFGRPTIATRSAPSSSASDASSTAICCPSSETMKSRRSPVPRPCCALTVCGSPAPRRMKSQEAASWISSSTLLTTRATCLPLFRAQRAACPSSSTSPVVTSTTRSTRSASLSAASACFETLDSSESPTSSHPPVSTTSKVTPFQSISTALRSRVTPRCSSTTATRFPARRLTRDDLPTFGRPTITTWGFFMTRPFLWSAPARVSFADLDPLCER